MNFEVALNVFAFLANSLLGLLVYTRNRKSATNQLFFLLSLSTCAWIATTYMSVHSAGYDATLLWTRAVMASATLQAFFFFLLFRTFPSTEISLKKRHLVPLLVANTALVGIAFSPFLFTRLTTTASGTYSPVPGPGIVLFLILAVGQVLGGLWLLIKKFRRSRANQRSQIVFLLAGVAIMFSLIIVFNLILPVFFHISAGINASPLFSVFFVALTAYAIVTQHLFDIRIIIRRTVVFSALIGFILFCYSGLLFVLTSVLGTQTADKTTNLVSNVIIALIIGYSFQPIQKWVEDRTDQWLFKKEYEQQAVLKDLGKHLNDVIALDEALEIVMRTITKVLHLHHAVTYVFQPSENGEFAIKRVKQIGYSSTARLILEDKDFTVNFFTHHQHILLTDDLMLELEREKHLLKDKKVDGAIIRDHAIKQAVHKKLSSLNVSAVVPLHLDNQPIGLIFLSEKMNGEAYHAPDLTLLELVGAQAISSIQKAKLYEGDQMKSEFVSIASHELLTPVSAIEGYLSMILEENIGKVDPQAREYLTKVYTSAKRLSMLIKDLLSVSRIESGKMKFVQQQLPIEKVINDTIDQLRFMAADKKLELKFVKPEHDLPPVWADPDRTIQVMINLVSNAIKYTPEGSITIETKLDKKAGMVTVSITDTGLGMSKAAQQHLFSKFYRVESPETTGIMGTGLGLYITKSVIEKMGGNITVKSKEGVGSTFAFSLPLFKVEASVIS